MWNYWWLYCNKKKNNNKDIGCNFRPYYERWPNFAKFKSYSRQNGKKFRMIPGNIWQNLSEIALKIKTDLQRSNFRPSAHLKVIDLSKVKYRSKGRPRGMLQFDLRSTGLWDIAENVFSVFLMTLTLTFDFF